MSQKLTINYTVLAGNLEGCDPMDTSSSADRYAPLVKKALLEAAREDYPDAEIEVNVDIQYRTSGAGPSLTAVLNNGNGDFDFLEDKYSHIPNEVWGEQWDEWAVMMDEDDAA